MADSKLPCVTDMVPRIWYAVMATRPGECMKVAGTELRDQTPADLAAILTALPAPERAELLAPFARISEDSWLDQEKARGLVMAERDQLRNGLAVALRERDATGFDLARATARAESSERALLESVRHSENQRRELAKLHAALRQKAPVDSPLTDSAGWNAWAAGWCEKLGLHGFDGIWHSAEAQDAIGKELAKKGAPSRSDDVNEDVVDGVAKGDAAGEGPRCRCIHPEEHGCRQWTDAELEGGVCPSDIALEEIWSLLGGLDDENLPTVRAMAREILSCRDRIRSLETTHRTDSATIARLESQLAAEFERGRRDGFYAGREACLTAIGKKFPHMKDDVAKGIGNACYGVPYEPAAANARLR